MTKPSPNPAELAAIAATKRIQECLNARSSFRVEAGAGAGKTYSLIEALRYLIKERGKSLTRNHQKIACITYTNVAKDQIDNRTDRHPVIHCATIHAFCWSLIKDFQAYLRSELASVHEYWNEQLDQVDGIGARSVNYDEVGFRAIDDKHVSLHHDDVIVFTVRLLGEVKFRNVVANRYPVLFFDEYQDTDTKIVDAIQTHFLDTGTGPLIGFFGDHWQKIYGSGCGAIEHANLVPIGKEANFRSAPEIVEGLNKMRPDLPQQASDPNAKGSIAVYHTNSWHGTRRTGQHWKGDLPAIDAHEYLDRLTALLEKNGWDLSPDKTKLLMLTHKSIAGKQGYMKLASVFQYPDSYIKKQDPYICLFAETIEPACIAFENRKFGEMFSAFGGRKPIIHSISEKQGWFDQMNQLLTLRTTGTVGEVMDYISSAEQLIFPDALLRRVDELRRWEDDDEHDEPEPSSISRLRNLRAVPYEEVIALTRFIEEKTPFSTKHGVKGAEFENVIVVFGRGWNKYDFNRFLEWKDSPPSDKTDSFERNRNLFYVVCSRPKTRLALLFTQELSKCALATLSDWFGNDSIQAL